MIREKTDNNDTMTTDIPKEEVQCREKSCKNTIFSEHVFSEINDWTGIIIEKKDGLKWAFWCGDHSENSKITDFASNNLKVKESVEW